MTATKYALVPVVADEWMFRAGEKHSLWPAITWSAMLAAAPKELPEEVVERAIGAYANGYDAAMDAGETSLHRAAMRAAIEAVLGGVG